MDDQRAAYLALALAPGIGSVRLHNLLAAFDTPLGALSAPFAFLCRVPGVSRACATAIAAAQLSDGVRTLEAADRLGARVLLPADAEFPELLRHIPDPPLALFALGDLSLLPRAAVAVVGSRDPSPYGAEACRLVAGTAAEAGVVVVSGMARGLDAVAHAAALDAAGGTIGVLGNGLGVVYPAANRQLYQRVADGGLLLTEHPPRERPHAGSFPRRNRLVSGLARATVVVEAGEGSGALITAGAALEQGRDVLAVPGPITSPLSVGANRLIRDGATPFLEPDDLLRLYPEVARRPGRSTGGVIAGPAVAPLPEALLPADRAIAQLLDGAGVHVDDLARRAERPVAEVLASLLSLEIAGVVVQGVGTVFRRV